MKYLRSPKVDVYVHVHMPFVPDILVLDKKGTIDLFHPRLMKLGMLINCGIKENPLNFHICR